jgi:predicted DCC family thiol-disulfide oxidoreductase YuxK
MKRQAAVFDTSCSVCVSIARRIAHHTKKTHNTPRIISTEASKPLVIYGFFPNSNLLVLAIAECRSRCPSEL